MRRTDAFYPWVPSTAFVGPDEELRYSLRSIDTYYNINKVYIVSEYDCPHWLTNVEYIKIPKSAPFHKEIQIKMCIEAAIAANISDPFLYVNDDQYSIDSQAAAWTQHLVANQPEPCLDIHTNNPWMQMTIGTLRQLRDSNKMYHNWCTHMPWYVYHKSYTTALKFFQHRMWQLESGVMNLQTQCWPVFLIDCPGIRIQFTEHNRPESLGPETCFLNHNDNGIRRSWYLIKKLFPEKSRYEK